MKSYTDEAMTKVNFRLNRSEVDRVKQIASRLKVTPSELFRDALSRHLDRIEIASSERRAA